jgi:gas vesicle protein
MSYKKTLAGFAAGAAVGAIAGILMAPDRGANTRKKIANKTNDLSDSLKDSFSDFIDSVKGMSRSGKKKTEALEDTAKAKMNGLKTEARQKVENSLS